MKLQRLNFRELSKGTVNLLFCCIILILSLTGCLNDDDEIPEPVPAAYVLLFHASPDAPDLDIFLDNNQINARPFEYAKYYGYVQFPVGDKNLEISPLNGTTTLLDTTLNFVTDKIYSVFLANQAAKMEAFVVEDTSATPATGKAMLRLIHLSPDAPALDLTIANENGTALFENQSFKQATPFKEVTAGTFTFELRETGESDAILSTPQISFQSGRIYTLIIRGFSTPPTGNTNELSIQVINN